jgi:amidase
MNIRIVFMIVIFISGSCIVQRPETAIDLTELTIAQVHDGISKGTFSCEELVRAYLERIDRNDSNIRSITTINTNAIEEARLLDEEFRKTKKLRPLHGIPVIAKDNIHTKGIVTSAGALALKNFIPEEDAFIIKKLKEAGAIVIAKSNMAEWAFTPWSSESSTHGITLNPYNIAYSPAGSSGGTAAAIASNFGIIGLGTDTGNSIRGPSSHCALVGFRATMGAISREGVIPLFIRNDMAGPMCRTVEDATRVLEVIASIDPADPISKYAVGKIPRDYTQYLNRDGLKGARIGVLRNIGDVPQDPQITILMEKALESMRSMGAVVIDSVVIPGDVLKENHWCSEFKNDIEAYLARYSRNDSLKTLEDIISAGTKLPFTAGELQSALRTQGRYSNPEVPCLDAYTDEARIAFRTAVEKYMNELKVDALVYPSWNVRPAKANQVFKSYDEGVGVNSAVISPHTGQPAFTVPMGFTAENLPVGLEFLGRMFDEPTLIKLIYAFEQGTKHRRAPNYSEVQR